MEQEKIWDYYQSEDLKSFDGSFGRLNFLSKQCFRNQKVLNIGVGGGVFEKIALSSHIDIHSLDPSEKAILNIQILLGEEKAKIGYSQNIPFEDNFFDVVIMSEVLEHLDDEILKATLKEVKRVLKKDGKFIGTVPFKENLSEQIVVCPKCAEQFHRWGHVQSFDEQRLYAFLVESFVNIKLKQKMFISWGVLNWKGKVSTILYYLFFLLNIKKNGLNLYFEGKK